jgi:hypothetical protein
MRACVGGWKMRENVWEGEEGEKGASGEGLRAKRSRVPQFRKQGWLVAVGEVAVHPLC